MHYYNTIKYLGLHSDQRLTWKLHIVAKIIHIKQKITKVHWLLGGKSKLSLENRILLYNIFVKLIWTYGIENWGCASKSNMVVMQRTQYRILRNLRNGLWNMQNYAIYNDLGIAFINDKIRNRSGNHNNKLIDHTNISSNIS